MAVSRWISYEADSPEGERFAPEVRAEIAAVAPSAVLNNSITTAKLRDQAVTRAKLGPGAVGPDELDSAAVETPNLADSAVTTAKLDDDSVTPAKCATGVVTAVDSAGNPTENMLRYLTSAQYAAIGTPDPNTTYFISA